MKRLIVAVTLAFLLGVISSPVFLPDVNASADGWQSRQINNVISLLEKIEENTRR